MNKYEMQTNYLIKLDYYESEVLTCNNRRANKPTLAVMTLLT